MAAWQPTGVFLYIHRTTRWPHQDLQDQWSLPVSFLAFVHWIFFFKLYEIFSLWCLSLLCSQCSSLHPSPPKSPLHLFHSAGTDTRRCTEASAQVSRASQPQPVWQECIYSLAPLCQEWMSKCSLQEQLLSEWSKERERLLRLLPLCLPCSQTFVFNEASGWAGSKPGECMMHSFAFWI